MKKVALTFGMVMLLFFGVCASSSEHFRFNQSELDQALQQAEAAEKLVKQHPGATYQELHKDWGIKLSPRPVISKGQPEKALGIPSFCWGGCCGIAGLAIVYFVTENKDETVKALWGCVASTVIYVAVYFIAGIGSLAVY